MTTSTVAPVATSTTSTVDPVVGCRAPTPAEAAAAIMAETTFGIEIETVGRSIATVAAAVVAGLATVGTAARYSAGTGYRGCDEVLLDDGRAWQVMRDGSLENGGAEIVSPILKGAADMAALQAIVRAVRACGAVSSASRNCGIHVHVGLVNAAPVVVARLAKLTNRIDAVLRQAIAIGANREHYARPLPAAFVRNVGNPTTRTELQASWTRHVAGGYYMPSRYDGSRYHGCNLNSWFVRGTAEFRYFNGTLHAGEVRAYVTLCLALVAKAHAGNVASTPLRAHRTGGVRKAFYQFLLHHGGLGLKGEANKAVLHHLTKHLPGTAPNHAAAAARAVALPASPTRAPARGLAASPRPCNPHQVRGRWHLSDGREYEGDPLDVVLHLRRLAFGYTGPRDTLAPFAEWLAARIGAPVQLHPAGTCDQVVATALLATLEARGHASRLTAEVHDIEAARARQRGRAHRRSLSLLFLPRAPPARRCTVHG